MSRQLLYAVTSSLMLTVAPLLAAASPDPEGPAVVFTAHDYGFAGPDRIQAGMTVVEIVNLGQDLHHAQLVKLSAGKTVKDLIGAMKADPTHLPNWISFVGGPNAVPPGDRTVAIVRLDAGQYAVICIIPDQKGVPHVMLGMEKPFTVMPVSQASHLEPQADITIVQRDFHFKISGPITAGRRTIHVVNEGGQTHEVVVVKLAPGTGAKDFLAALEPGASAPPPGRPAGGIVGLDRGGRGFFKAKFEPGHYALICFFEDPATGRPHFAQGMTWEFDVE